MHLQDIIRTLLALSDRERAAVCDALLESLEDNPDAAALVSQAVACDERSLH